MKFISLAIAGALVNASASAALYNGGFEDGLAGYTSRGNVDVVDHFVDDAGRHWDATEGSKFAVLETYSSFSTAAYGGTTGSVLTKSLSIQKGDRVSFDWAFTTADLLPFNDFAIVLGNDGTRFELSNIAMVGSAGTTGWMHSMFVADRDYIGSVRFVVSNEGDQIPYSQLLLDNMQVAPVPEPETWALMGLGLTSLIFSRRRKHK